VTAAWMVDASAGTRGGLGLGDEARLLAPATLVEKLCQQ